MLALPPDTDDKVLIELWVRKEELDAQTKAAGIRVMRTLPDIETLKNLLDRHEDMLENLRAPYTQIVSIREYVKIINDLKRMRKILRDMDDYIRMERESIKAFEKERAAVLDMIERRKNPNNLIRFRPRGTI